MNIIYSDENGRLTDEIRELMERAAAEAAELEFGEALRADDIDPAETEAEIGVTVVDAEEIRNLNSEYRGNDSVTDVLSFPQYDDIGDLINDLADSAGPVLLGDVVICYDKVLGQAEEYGTGVTREFVYMFTHSILHLLGYDHMDEDEKRVMREREEEILQAIGVTR